MQDNNGTLCSNRSDIANVFAQFYEELYRLRSTDEQQTQNAESTDKTGQTQNVESTDKTKKEIVEPITVEELRAQLKVMANKKAPKRGHTRKALSQNS